MAVNRVWRGWASSANADSYESLVAEQVLPAMTELPGYLGASFQKRQTAEGETEFLVITRWQSIDAIRGFAGEDYESATIPNEAARLLERYDDRAIHYQQIANDGPEP